MSERFATTHWSLVVAAAGERSSPEGETALQTLCESYWPPLYAFARRRGKSVEDARDLTQEFFARLLEKESLQVADREKGQFRSFLLMMFRRFLANEWDRDRALKRGGGRIVLSLDVDSAETLYRREPIDDHTPERVFERRWALTLLERVLTRLEEEYDGQGKSVLFKQCRSYLTGDSGAPRYAETADVLGMTEGALKVAVHRIRGRYRTLLKIEVAQTLADETDVDDELGLLLAALRGKKA